MLAQRNIVRTVYNISIDGPQAFAYTFAGLMQQFEGRGGAVCRGVMPVDCLHGGGHLVDCLESLVDGPFPSGVVNHAASISYARIIGLRSATFRREAYVGL
jgi:hypothetical protein